MAWLAVDGELGGWRNLNAGAERGVTCGHMQVLITNLPQRHLGMARGQQLCLECASAMQNVRGELGCANSFRRGPTKGRGEDLECRGRARTDSGGHQGGDDRHERVSQLENCEESLSPHPPKNRPQPFSFHTFSRRPGRPRTIFLQQTKASTRPCLMHLEYRNSRFGAAIFGFSVWLQAMTEEVSV